MVGLTALTLVEKKVSLRAVSSVLWLVGHLAVWKGLHLAVWKGMKKVVL